MLYGIKINSSSITKQSFYISHSFNSLHEEILADEAHGHNMMEGKTLAEVMKRHEEMLNGKTNRTTLNIPQNTTEKGNNARGRYYSGKQNML